MNNSIFTAFDRIYDRICEQESLGRKIFKDKEDIEAWNVLKKWFRKDEGYGEGSLDFGDENKNDSDVGDVGDEYRRDVF